MAKRIVGIDFGLARIGVALSDPFQIIASPCHTLQNMKNNELTAKALLKILEPHQIHEIVIGMPYKLNGTSSSSTEETLKFVEELKKHSSYPVILWDERLTTMQVEKSMKEESISRKKRTKIIDAACATLILQNYLDLKQNTLTYSNA